MTRLTTVLAAALSMPFACGALAQGAYPNKPVTVVVGFEPGGGTDTTARILQKPLGDLLGQQVVVENRAGAGGDIAVDYVAKARRTATPSCSPTWARSRSTRISSRRPTTR